MRYRVVLSRKF